MGIKPQNLSLFWHQMGKWLSRIMLYRYLGASKRGRLWAVPGKWHSLKSLRVAGKTWEGRFRGVGLEMGLDLGRITVRYSTGRGRNIVHI